MCLMNQFDQREENTNEKAKSKRQKQNFYEGHDLLKSNEELR